MNELAHHRIMVKRDVSGVRALIELRLGVKTSIGDRDAHAGTAIDFLAPRDIDLDFLRPDVLPPK